MRGTRGLTLVEAVVGVALIGGAALVLAGLFRAGIASFNYTTRQCLVLESARRAFHGDGKGIGMLSSSLNSAAVVSFSTGTADLDLPGSGRVRYYSQGGRLFRSHGGVAKEQARAVTSLEVRYYNLDDQGLVIESTAPESAAFMTGRIMLRGPAAGRDYEFVSGAALRNHP